MSDHIRALVTRPLSHSKVTCDTNLFTREIKSSLVRDYAEQPKCEIESRERVERESRESKPDVRPEAERQSTRDSQVESSGRGSTRAMPEGEYIYKHARPIPPNYIAETAQLYTGNRDSTPRGNRPRLSISQSAILRAYHILRALCTHRTIRGIN